MKNLIEQIELSALIPDTLAGLRLDQALGILFSEYSRSRLQSWITANQVTVNGKILRPRDKVFGGELVIIRTTLPLQDQWQAQAIPLNIVYEDEAILIVNKPPNLVVHPAAGNREGTLVNALLHHAPELGTLPRAGIVHRLDKDTSGLLVVAKTLTAQTHLVKQLQKRLIKREYAAIATGQLTAGGTIDAAIGRHPVHRTRMAVNTTGKPAITHYRIIERFSAYTLLKVILETGRTHQIRVHLSYMRHPLLGDTVYGGRLQLPSAASPELIAILRNFRRQALHAQRLGLQHPLTENYCEWEAAIPDDMQQVISALRASSTM